jgi:hypothetical protein
MEGRFSMVILTVNLSEGGIQFPARAGSRRATSRQLLGPLLSTKEAYNESVFHKSEADTTRRAECRLRRRAAQLGFQIIPAENG